MQKHLFEFLAIKLTLHDYVQYLYKENAYKIGGLRPDSLSLLMHHAHI